MAISINVQDVAQAVADELSGAAGGTFTLSATFSRVTDTQRRLEDLTADPLVDVLGVEWDQQIEDREADRVECAVGVAVRAKLSGTDNADVDPLHNLVREIHNYLNRRDLSGLSVEHAWQGVEFPVLIDETALDKRVFFNAGVVSYLLVG